MTHFPCARREPVGGYVFSLLHCAIPLFTASPRALSFAIDLNSQAWPDPRTPMIDLTSSIQFLGAVLSAMGTLVCTNGVNAMGWPSC